MTGTCHHCGPTEDELRPYGPGGATICFPCMTATPEREAEAAANYTALLEAAGTMTGVAVIGTQAGPQPYLDGDLDPKDTNG